MRRTGRVWWLQFRLWISESSFAGAVRPHSALGYRPPAPESWCCQRKTWLSRAGRWSSFTEWQTATHSSISRRLPKSSAWRLWCMCVIHFRFENWKLRLPIRYHIVKIHSKTSWLNRELSTAIESRTLQDEVIHIEIINACDIYFKVVNCISVNIASH